jgi:hypothetical protein
MIKHKRFSGAVEKTTTMENGIPFAAHWEILTKDGEGNTVTFKVRRKVVAELDKATANSVILDKGAIALEVGAVCFHLKRRIYYAKLSNQISDGKVATVNLNPIRDIIMSDRTRIMRHRLVVRHLF